MQVVLGLAVGGLGLIMGLLLVTVVLSALNLSRNGSPVRRHEASLVLASTVAILVAILTSIGLSAGALAAWVSPLWVAFSVPIGTAAGIMFGAVTFFVSKLGIFRSRPKFRLDTRLE